jgi:hypothetical protein
MGKPLDLTNQKFGRLKVIKYTGESSSNKRKMWECVCDCGNTCVVASGKLKEGKVKSCGCLSKEKSKENITKYAMKGLVHVNGTELTSLLSDTISVNNKTGVKGVCLLNRLDLPHKKYKAYIKVDGKLKELGNYTNLDEAKKARKEAEQKYYVKYYKLLELIKKEKIIFASKVDLSEDDITALVGKPPVDNIELSEGKALDIILNKYERSRVARLLCIKHHGAVCCVCGFNPKITYGIEFENKIHVHHKKMISESEGEYIVDHINDLCPVCPNCHMIIHSRKQPYTIEEVKAFLKKQA